MGKNKRKGQIVVEADVVSDDVSVRQKNNRQCVDKINSENSLKTGIENPLGNKSVINSKNTVQDTMHMSCTSSTSNLMSNSLHMNPINTENVSQSFITNEHKHKTPERCNEQMFILDRGDNPTQFPLPIHDLTDDSSVDELHEPVPPRTGRTYSCPPVTRSDYPNTIRQNHGDVRSKQMINPVYQPPKYQLPDNRDDLPTILKDMQKFLNTIQSDVSVPHQSPRKSHTETAQCKTLSRHSRASRKTQSERQLKRARLIDENSSSSDDSTGSSTSDSDDESVSTSIVTQKRRPRKFSHKLPPFTGQDKEKWVVWKGRFEEMADRGSWTNSERLDELLPRMQGSAGEFVFEQLTKRTRSNYKKLIRELDNRYQVIETKNSLEAKFSNCRQKPNEPVEIYAADLKKLYAKAYPNRDETMRKEDLLRKFFDGLNDEKVQFQVEYIKEPDNIDDAVFQVINFSDLHKRSSSKADKRPIRAVAENDKKTGNYKRFENKEKQSKTALENDASCKTTPKSKTSETTTADLKDDILKIQRQIQNLEKMLSEMSKSSAFPPRYKSAHDNTCYVSESRSFRS